MVSMYRSTEFICVHVNVCISFLGPFKRLSSAQLAELIAKRKRFYYIDLAFVLYSNVKNILPQPSSRTLIIKLRLTILGHHSQNDFINDHCSLGAGLGYSYLKHLLCRT